MFIDGLKYGLLVYLLSFILILIRKFIHKEGIRSFLLSFDKYSILLLLKGIVIGIILMILYALIVVLIGQANLVIKPKNAIECLKTLGISVFMFSSIALFEECFYRGYLMQIIMKRMALRWAVLIPSLIFASWHLIAYSNDKYFWGFGLLCG